MANEKIVNRDNLKTFRQELDKRYAKPDGYYPTMTVGLADNLTPYSEDSGAEQTNPFISNGTGTNNNTEIVTVGDYGLFKEKQSNTLVVNQWLLNPDFASTSGWSTLNGSFSVSNNIATFTANAQNGQLFQGSVSRIASHYYLAKCSIKLTTATTNVQLMYAGTARATAQATTDWQTLVSIFSMNSSGATFFVINDSRTSDWDAVQVKDVAFIDLTKMFNGDIPQDLLDNPSHFFWYYNGDLSYNEGTLVNANGVKLVSTGRQQWDEETELGSLDLNTGAETSSSNELRTDFIRVISNTPYYINTKLYKVILCYDKNQNYVGRASEVAQTSGVVFTTLSNCAYIRVPFVKQYGTTYKNDITISLYYTPEQGGEGYDKYYPYEEPYEVDTGSEVLRSAGSVKDYKEPNGTIHRVVGMVDLGSLEWTYNDTAHTFTSNSISAGKINSNQNMACSKYYIANGRKSVSNPPADKEIAQRGRNDIFQLILTDTTLQSTDIPTGTLYFELATPLPPEQGTPFAENLPINDYGMLYWLDENDNLVGVPQGAKIFYPTNYKGFVDDMYSRVDGDSSQYVIQSELQASETQRDTIDAQLKNAIGGTLRQLLAVSKNLDFNNIEFVDLGTLAWVLNTDQSFNRFQAGLSGIGSTFNNCICTIYATPSSALGSDQENKTIKLGSNNQIYVRDDSYNDITTFKNAMKGVLLAYEKA